MTRQTGQVVDLRDEQLEEFRARFQALNYSHHTGKAYLRTTRRLLDAYRDVPLERFTAEHVERYLHAQRWAPRTVSTKLENVRPFFQWLWKQKRLVRVNPCDGVERPRWKPRLRPAPTWDKFRAIREQCQTLREPLS